METDIKKILYLDYASTTPVDPRVLDEMLPYFTEHFGNPASRTHAYGWDAENAVKEARESVGKLIGGKPEEIVFTSGATEAINLAIKGVYDSYTNKGNHIITVKTEHKAVLDTCQYLETKGANVTYLPVKEDGLIDLDTLRESITEQTILISVMYANNETGVIQPIKEIASIAHQAGIFFMTDATQAVGKIPIDVNTDGIDLLTCSSHKLYGPKGIGALYVKQQYPKIKITPLIHGGGHERGMRSGTLNSPLIVGFGKACEITKKEMNEDKERLSSLRNELERQLKSIEGCKIHAENTLRLPHITNLYFEDIDAEALIMAVRDKIAIANGSACTSAEILPSHVIMAMYDDEDIAYCSIRVSFGKLSDNNDTISIFQYLKSSVESIQSNFS